MIISSNIAILYQCMIATNNISQISLPQKWLFQLESQGLPENGAENEEPNFKPLLNQPQSLV